MDDYGNHPVLPLLEEGPQDERAVGNANAVHNHYHGHVNNSYIGSAFNPNFGANYGSTNQTMYQSTFPMQWREATSGGPMQPIAEVDVFSLLNPILDASHTRNMKLSPPNSQCLPGTRREVIGDIRAWADSDNLETNPHMMWIFGYAGCGKSAIAHEVATICADENRLAACFVFLRGSRDRSRTARFATTIASQVASAISEIEPIIQSTVRKRPNLLNHDTASLSEQFKHLIYFPIQAVASKYSAPFIIVLDAVDECQDRDEVSALIENMSEFFKQHPNTPLRFLITSRVEDHLHQVLHSSDQVQLLNLVERTSDTDIAAALTVAIEKEARGQVLCRHGSWPSAEDMAKLVKHIGGSFIFMSTVVKRLFDRSIKDGLTPMERLPLVLSMNPDFDDLYQEILTPCQHFLHFQAVITAIILAIRPLSVAELAEIINIKIYDVANVLINMSAIIQVPGDDRTPVTLWHTSLREYLSDKQRSGPICANPSHHRWLAHRCISLASASQKATRYPPSDYSRDYAIQHLAKMVETMKQNPTTLVRELRAVMRTLQIPVYKDKQTALEVACHEPLNGAVCALHAACYYGQSTLIYLLLKKGANPNIISPRNDVGGFHHGTPLAFAASVKDVKLAARLLECGADPNLQGGWWGTALRAACFVGSLELVNLLLNHGIDPNLQNPFERWPLLHLCTWRGEKGCARALLTYNADPNVQDDDGDSPLHYACGEGDVEFVDCLLKFSVNASLRNKEGQTALQVAREKEHHDIVQTLFRHGVVG